jgi:hypothetical protein
MSEQDRLDKVAAEIAAMKAEVKGETPDRTLERLDRIERNLEELLGRVQPDPQPPEDRDGRITFYESRGEYRKADLLRMERMLDRGRNRGGKDG